MAKKIILGLILALIVVFAVALISGVVYYSSDYMSNNPNFYQPEVNYHNDNSYNADNADTHANIQVHQDIHPNNEIKCQTCNKQASMPEKTPVKDGCYEEIIQVKDPGQCIGIPQEKKLCYQHVITCSGMRTVSLDCYPDVPQEKGNGECIGVPQEKGICYKQVVSCSGMKTVSIDCYPQIFQEKGYGECEGLPQEKAPCYRENDYSRCPN